jgi:hypothetical protein
MEYLAMVAIFRVYKWKKRLKKTEGKTLKLNINTLYIYKSLLDMATSSAPYIPKDKYHPVMAYKFQRECCTSGTCSVATFKPGCCTQDTFPKCHYLCPKNNPWCHDTLCCECHQTTIYRISAPLEIRKPAYICGGCGYRVCNDCIPTIEFKYDTKTKVKICPKCDFFW